VAQGAYDREAERLPSAAGTGGRSPLVTVRCKARFGVIGGNALEFSSGVRILNDYATCLPQP
jgi:hypothetical protein